MVTGFQINGFDVETIIVGGGQAGLSAGYFLQQQGREYLILERAEKPGNAWRNDRWDSFTLVTPNWSFRLPGGEYAGDQPGGFMPRDEIVRQFETYEAHNRLAVQHGVEVTSVEAGEPGYIVRTERSVYRAKNVIIASGLFQEPKVPSFTARLDPQFVQLHSGQYRNPAALPPGAVLVVGSAQSGCQIAEELYQAGRTVYLSVCSAGRVPRRYRSKDIFEWLHQGGFFDRTVDQLPAPQARFAGNPHLSGKDGGHEINLHRFYREGVRLLGRVQDVQDGKLIFAADLQDSLTKSEAFEAMALKMIDEYLAKNHPGIPVEQRTLLNDAYTAPEILSLDPRAAGIGTIIWAIGYRFDFSMVKFPVFEPNGFPITQRGLTQFPGLAFLGMPWLHTQKGGLLIGVGEDAEHLIRRLQR